jgi:endonuclease/exonuclease/phosphatase family metal-dependent hydrolase
VGTYNGFIGKSNGPKIDYIMVKPDIEVIEASILKSNRKGRYPSDHFPVTAQLRIKN